MRTFGVTALKLTAAALIALVLDGCATTAPTDSSRAAAKDEKGQTELQGIPSPERAGAGPPRGCLRQAQEPAPDLRLHVVDRARRDQHDHRRRGGHDQPPAGPPLPERLLRQPPARPGPPAGRAPRRARRLGLRRLPPRLALLRPHLTPRAAPLEPARGLSGPDRPGGHRRRDDLAARGRPVRGLDWPDRFFERRVWRIRRPCRRPTSWPTSSAWSAKRSARSSWPAVGRSTREPGGARRLRHGVRHPGLREPGGQGRAALEPPDERRARWARPAAWRPTGSPSTPTWSSR